MNTITQELTASKTVPWMALLDEALNKPGMLSEAYQTFHSYSMGNMMLAMTQTSPENLGPIATFKRWKELGRNVRKGEKAICLYMPITIKDKDEETENVKAIRTGFMLRRNWFYLSQTDGDQTPQFDPPAEWSIQRALSALNVTQTPFNCIDGNSLGYAVPTKREIAISPLSTHPLRTLFHELAHVELHGDVKSLAQHGQKLPKDVKEVEAESVSYLIASALGVEMSQADFSRGYIQDWMRDKNARADFAKTRASRVFGCAQRIIAAGKPKQNQKAE